MKKLKINSNLIKEIIKGASFLLMPSFITYTTLSSVEYYATESLEVKKEIERAADKSFKSLLSLDEVNLSEEAKNAIDEISSTSLNMPLLDDLAITKVSAAATFATPEVAEKHENTTLYDKKTDDIKWDEVGEVIYQNGLTRDLEDNLEALNEEEVIEQVNYIHDTYNEVKKDFEDYDTKTLACNLENYAFLKSSTKNGSVVASTSSDKITFYPTYYSYSDKMQEKVSKHESFHLLTNTCYDADIKYAGGINVLNLVFGYNNKNRNMSGYSYSFIEEIYAELYSSLITSTSQTTYHNYDEALDLLQASLALGENYQVDDLLKKTVYKDPVGFIKELPTFGPNKGKFLLDTLKVIKGLDLVVNPDLEYLEQVQKENDGISYEEILKEIKDYCIKGLGKIYYNNLIMLNEKHDLSLIDNTALAQLYFKLANNIREGVVLEEDTTSDNSIHITSNDPGVNDYYDIFIEYLSKKYDLGKDTIYNIINSSYINDISYQMPEILGEEKQEFYQWLWEDKSGEIDFDNRVLVK